MTALVPSPIRSWLQKPGLRVNELTALVDLIPIAVCLVDVSKRKVIMANARITELTSFTREEMATQELGFYLRQQQDDENAYLRDENTHELILTKRDGTTVEVRTTLHYLDSIKSTGLLLIEPSAVHQKLQAERKRQSQTWKAIESLALTLQESSLQPALEKILQAGRALTGSSILAIYLADSQTPSLQRNASIGNGEFLPASLPASELNKLRKPNLWIPGKHTTSPLHRSALAADMNYVLTAPIGQQNAVIGMLAITDSVEPPTENILPVLNIMSAFISGAIQNHTLQTNHNQKIQDQNRALSFNEAINENIQDGVIVIGPDLTILEMNNAAEQQLGYASREVEGHPIDNILIGAKNLTAALLTAKQGVATHNLGNIHLHRRDGQAFLAHIRLIPITSEGAPTSVGAPENILIFIQDLSKHEQYRIQTQQLEQRALLGEVTAIFAHEVRNPINNISTTLQLMALDFSQDDPKRDQIRRMEEDANRLTHLMDSVLSFSKATEYQVKPMEIEVLLRRMVERWRPRMARVNVEHELQIGPRIPLVMGDSRALEQVFTNLISNAIQAMGETGGVLTIRVQPEVGPGAVQHVEISVSDTGAGIAEEIRERIFEPFFTTHPEGTGLGLSITKRIITAHKGSIKVTSVPGGTVFQVRLPAADNQTKNTFLDINS